MASVTLLRPCPNPTPKTTARPCSGTVNSRPFLPPTINRLRGSARPTVTCMSYNPTPATDRLISAVAYTLPFFNSLPYGRFLFKQYPKLGLLVEPILPLVSAYKSIPYASLVAFFALYMGVVRNSRFSHYARFNAMQAVSLDVLLVLPLVLQRVFTPGRPILVYGYNALFVVAALCFVYGFVFSVLGRTPYLPFVSGAASQQL